MNVVNFETGQCKRTRDLLEFYLNSELTVETSQDVLKHLRACDACSEVLRERQWLKDRLREAALREAAPPELEARIRRSLRRSPSVNWGRWSLAAAALLVLTIGAVFVLNGVNEPSQAPYVATTPGAPKEANALQIGLANHVHCTVERRFGRQAHTEDEMAHALGSEWFELATQISRSIPESYKVVAGHHCRLRGRQFVHLVLSGADERLISVTITGKQGESFSPQDLATILDETGGSIYQARLSDYDVAGFESGNYLAFVVSNLQRADSFRLTAALAPPVTGLLSRL